MIIEERYGEPKFPFVEHNEAVASRTRCVQYKNCRFGPRWRLQGCLSRGKSNGKKPITIAIIIIVIITRDEQTTHKAAAAASPKGVAIRFCFLSFPSREIGRKQYTQMSTACTDIGRSLKQRTFLAGRPPCEKRPEDTRRKQKNTSPGRDLHIC